MTPVPRVVHHVTLTVTDAARSADWYQSLLGPASVVERRGDTWRRLRMQWPSGLVIGVTQHQATALARFDESRVGLDHIGIACDSEQEVAAWVTHMDAIGLEHGPLEDVPYGWAVTARDPDAIPIEFFCSKP